MNKNADFRIEKDLSMEELVNDARTYPMLRSRLRDMGKKDDADELIIAEMNTNISILYKYYLEDTVDEMFRIGALGEESEIYIVRWGSQNRKTRYMSKLCLMLSGLSVDRIAETQEMTDMYHELTEMIDGSRVTNRRSFVLEDADFWNTYFEFNEAYWDGRE